MYNHVHVSHYRENLLRRPLAEGGHKSLAWTGLRTKLLGPDYHSVSATATTSWRIQHACRSSVYTVSHEANVPTCMKIYSVHCITLHQCCKMHANVQCTLRLCASLLWQIALMLLLSVLTLDSYIDYNHWVMWNYYLRYSCLINMLLLKYLTACQLKSTFGWNLRFSGQPIV